MVKLTGGLFPRLVALFPLLFPLYLYRGTFLGIPVTLTEILLGILFLAFLAQQYEFRLRDWKLWPLYLFLLAAVLGVLIVPETSTWIDGSVFPAQTKALGILKGWILAPILYFVMARTVFREKPSMIPLALRALLLSGVLLSLLALKQVLTGDYLTVDARASGPFESANYLSLYVGPLTVYAILAFLKKGPLKDRIYLGLSAVISALALFFTYSYAAWLAVFVSLLVALLLFIRKKGIRPFSTILIGLFLVGFILIFSQLDSDKWAQMLELAERSSSSVRLQVYEISLALIQSHPLLGIGLGQFEQQYQEVAILVLGQAPFEWNMLHPHNVFLAFWLNMGLLGLASFLWLSFKALAWLTEEDKKERHLAALMLVAILAHGLFDTPYFKNDLSFQFWLLLAMLI